MPSSLLFHISSFLIKALNVMNFPQTLLSLYLLNFDIKLLWLLSSKYFQISRMTLTHYLLKSVYLISKVNFKPLPCHFVVCIWINCMIYAFPLYRLCSYLFPWFSSLLTETLLPWRYSNPFSWLTSFLQGLAWALFPGSLLDPLMLVHLLLSLHFHVWSSFSFKN